MLKESVIKLEEGNRITIPNIFIKSMLLREGDEIRISTDESIQRRCFHISSENEKELFDEDFYYIPKRIFEECGITYDDVQVILDHGNITITSSEHIVASLGSELITCLMNQNVDPGLLADDLVDIMNEKFYEEDLQGH